MRNNLVVDVLPLFERIARLADVYEPGIEVTEWKTKQISKILIEGMVYRRSDYETIRSVIYEFVEVGFEPRHASLVTMELIDYMYDKLFDCSGPDAFELRYSNEKVHYNDDLSCITIAFKARKSNGQTIAVRPSD